MAYDIHIALSGEVLSTDAVSLDPRQFSSVMRFVYPSTTPVMYKLSDDLRDASIPHGELVEMKNEIKMICIEMIKKKSDPKILYDLVQLIEAADKMGKGLRSLCD
jgi:hypothetical protein